MPADGFVVGRDKQVLTAANWSPNVFTAAAGSLFIPDNSVHEHNNPAEPLTGGGHNWVFDQGSTLCKETDVGKDPKTGLATGWAIPPNTATDCIVLPVVKNGTVTNLGDIPFQGEAITPTCDPTKLSTGTNPKANTYFNQLGCSISGGKATTPQTATSWLFVAGIKGGLFSIQLNNVTNAKVASDAGKTVGPQNYYSAIPEGLKLTNAAVSQDGQFAIATSIRRATFVYACFNPLGDPGPITKPINPNFFVPPGNAVPCMQVGSNGLKQDSTTAFGPDNQPYFGGQRVVTTFDSQPGGTSRSAWPQCIWENNGSTSMADAFARGNAGGVGVIAGGGGGGGGGNAGGGNAGGGGGVTAGGGSVTLTNGCGTAFANSGFTSALITQPSALITNGNYMYSGPVGGTVAQFKLTVNPVSGMTEYRFRTYLTGVSITTGMGVANDQKSLMVFSDPSAIGLAGQAVVTKLPLCEDM
jgi:hypothetical protein